MSPTNEAIPKEEKPIQFIVDPAKRAKYKAEMVEKMEYLLFATEFEMARKQAAIGPALALREELKAKWEKSKNDVAAIRFNGKERKDANAANELAKAELTTHEADVIVPLKQDTQRLVKNIQEYKESLDALMKYDAAE